MKKCNQIFINNKDYYTIVRINNRTISVPSPSLKHKQRYFLNAIKWVYPYKISTLDCAKIHCGKKWILKMDIKEFFSSIPFDDIQNVIMNVLKYINKQDEFINHIILTTIDNKLPTGAPTSPYLAEMCFNEVDKTIRNTCYLHNIDYTRYVDDLTFSSDCKESLKFIEKRVAEILSYSGYKINPKKTKYISSAKQQNILGLVVNDNKIRLSNDFKRKIRAMLHQYYFRFKMSGNTTIKDLKYLAWDEKRTFSLFGYLNYIKSVDYEYYLKLEKYREKLSKK